MGRHNSGRPIYAGLSHPVVVYRTRREQELPVWQTTDPEPRAWGWADLDGAPTPAQPATDRRGWRSEDTREIRAYPRAESSEWHHVRWYHTRVTVDPELRGTTAIPGVPLLGAGLGLRGRSVRGQHPHRHPDHLRPHRLRRPRGTRPHAGLTLRLAGRQLGPNCATEAGHGRSCPTGQLAETGRDRGAARGVGEGRHRLDRPIFGGSGAARMVPPRGAGGAPRRPGGASLR